MADNKMKKPKKVNKTQCRTCLYRSVKGDEILGCYYMLFMGHSRGCKPSPNCTKYKRFNQRERNELERNMTF